MITIPASCSNWMTACLYCQDEKLGKRMMSQTAGIWGIPDWQNVGRITRECKYLWAEIHNKSITVKECMNNETYHFSMGIVENNPRSWVVINSYNMLIDRAFSNKVASYCLLITVKFNFPVYFLWTAKTISNLKKESDACDPLRKC